MGSQQVPAVLRRTSGNIGAIMFLKPLWFFRRGGPDQKMLLAISPYREGFYPFTGTVPFGHPRSYHQHSNFIPA
jgi:hypothetical protein